MSEIRVTVDDFGLRAANDDAIVELARAGRIDAVSVMVHEDAHTGRTGELTALVATGLHLTLIGERPLRPEALAPLLDREGRLPGAWPRLFLALARHPRSVRGLRPEIAAQLDRYQSLGLPLDFVNGHQHAHLFPPVWRALRDELEARGVRPSIRVASGRDPKTLAIGAAQRASFAIARPWANATRIVSHGLAWSGRATIGEVETTLRELRSTGAHEDGVDEIVFHPGRHTGEVAERHAQWHYAWDDETELLASGAVDRAIERYGLRRR